MFPPFDVGDDPESLQRYLGHVAETFQNRDQAMASLVATLSEYIDTEMIGLDGKRAICLAKPIGAGSATAGSFICSLNRATGEITVSSGSYQYPISTNTDVAATGPQSGTYVYARIRQTSDGGLETDGFSITIEGSTLPPFQRDAGDTFVEYSNVLLAEVIGSGNEAQIIQRRIGNLSLVYRLINGSYCLWAETTGGGSL